MAEERLPAHVLTASRSLVWLVALSAALLGLCALAVSYHRGLMLLMDDAETYLTEARRLAESPSLRLLLPPKRPPLPRLLDAALAWNMTLWQTGLAGAIPSFLCYVAAVVGIYRISLRLMPVAWALVAAVALGSNPNLLYYSTTAMTELPCLAAQIWLVLAGCELLTAIRSGPPDGTRRQFLLLGLVTFTAVLTRFDAWPTCAAVWCLVAAEVYRTQRKSPKSRVLVRFFGLFTVLAVAAPLLLMAYNHFVFGDSFAFLYGRQSVQADVDRMAVNGFPAKHHLLYALRQYLGCAVAMLGGGYAVALVAGAAVLFGTWRLSLRPERAAFMLLCIPFFFYTLAVWGGRLYIWFGPANPGTLAGVRYGLEMLPLIACVGVYGAYQLAQHPKMRKVPWAGVLPAVTLLLVLAEVAWISYRSPATLQEARQNASQRMDLELALSAKLAAMHNAGPIVMGAPGKIRGGRGAIERAGIPYRRIRYADSIDLTQGSPLVPATYGAYLVAAEGDGLYQAILRHPEGLEPMGRVCHNGSDCVFLYRSLLANPGVW